MNSSVLRSDSGISSSQVYKTCFRRLAAEITLPASPDIIPIVNVWTFFEKVYTRMENKILVNKLYGKKETLNTIGTINDWDID